MIPQRILIIADIEGSSACLDRSSAKFLGRGWPRACLGMTKDVNAVATALFRAGAGRVVIRDFHRTAYNIMPGLVHPKAVLAQGYTTGPVPGMGAPGEFDGLMMLGMHAPSGSSGFLPHTLTSRIARVTVNNSLVSEAQLFSAALEPFGIPPLFFSGCPSACAHTETSMPGVRCFPIDKFSPGFHAPSWRKRLAQEAVRALSAPKDTLYNPRGEFRVIVTMAKGKAAAKISAQRWGYKHQGANIYVDVASFSALFRELSRIAFLTPLAERLAPLGLPLYHLMGRAGLAWAQKKAPVSGKISRARG
ncbi:MAG: M55 family metallopeptidase [Desulfobacter sp.]